MSFASALPFATVASPPPDGGDGFRAAFIASLVALATGVPPAQIVRADRVGAAACDARHIAMYLAYVGLSWPLDRVAAAFGRERSSASYACRKVEDLRDDAAFDARLDVLEACLRAAPEPA